MILLRKSKIKMNKNKSEYIKLVAKIINSFLEFGFLNGPKKGPSLLDQATTSLKETSKAAASLWSYYGGGGLFEYDPKHPDNVYKEQEQKKAEEFEMQMTYRNPQMPVEVTHHWDYISKYLDGLETVKFINLHQQSQQELTKKGKGIKWIILALYRSEDLMQAFLTMFNEADYMLMYC